MMIHYVYMLHLLDDSRYVGSRSCECDPEEDDYFGSASDPYVCKENTVRKQIIDTFPTRKEANEFERFLHQIYRVDISEKFRNKVIAPSDKFYNDGSFVTEKLRKASKKVGLANLGKKHPNNSSGYVGVWWNQRDRCWKSEICFKGTRYRFGSYSTAEEASKAYEIGLKILKEGGEPAPNLPASGFKGVYSTGKLWVARICINGKRKYFGKFATPEEAHQAYLEAKATT